MLPVASIYVDSLGPLYHELELRIQLATTDRAHPRHTREQIGKDGDWSLTSYLRKLAAPRILWLHRTTNEAANSGDCFGKDRLCRENQNPDR
jgi:hypothetical protein